MDLNLKVLSLGIVECLVPQKCLLPKHKYKFRPGSWTKCIFQDDSFAVCQIFPREHSEQSCYLDKSVGSAEHSPAVELKRLELLQEVTACGIDITIVINEHFFKKNKKISLENIKGTVKHLLQPLYLTKACTVRNADLLYFGIVAVHVKAKSVEHGYFSLLEDTAINVTDVQLQWSMLETLKRFHKFAFEEVYRELQDLLNLAHLQRTRCMLGNMKLSVNALIVGPTGCGKSTLLAAFIKEHSCNCFRISMANIIGQFPGEIEAELRHIFDMAQTFLKCLKPLSPTVILLEELHLLCPAISRTNNSTDAGHAARICAQLLSLVDKVYRSGLDIICIATTADPESLNEVARRPGRFEREITISTPSTDIRRELFLKLFEENVEGHYLNAELLDLITKHTQGFVVADLALLVRNISQTLLTKKTRDLMTIVKMALQTSKPTSLRNTDVTVFKTERGFDAIGGMLQLKRTLEVSVMAGLRHEQSFQRFGLTLPKGILLYGPPGCAKTTLAKCLAAEACMTFVATSAAEVYSPYVGCAEKFIAKIFDAARKNAPCLIFLDEIDSLVGRRTFGKSGASGDVQTRILATLLTEMDGILAKATSSHILVVAATNRPDMIDDALLRPGRFDKLIHVPAPDMESRRAILALYAKQMPISGDVDFTLIAERLKNYSGADICNFCNEAALQSLQRDFEATTISARDFDTVLSTQKSSLTQQQIDAYFEFEKVQ